MNREIPFLSGPDGTSLADYRRFSNLSAYLKVCSAAYPIEFKDSPHLLQMMKACGFKVSRAQQFREMKEGWDSLTLEKIPLAYLNTIGACRGQIEVEAAKDMREFRKMADLEISPETYSVRYMPVVYGGGALPAGMSVDAAAQWVWAKMDENGRRLPFHFNFPDLKTVFFKKDGSSFIIWYPPEIRWGKHSLFTGGNGALVGKCFL